MNNKFKVVVGLNGLCAASADSGDTEVTASGCGYITISKTDGSKMTQVEIKQAQELCESDGCFDVVVGDSGNVDPKSLTMDDMMQFIGSEQDPKDYLLELLQGKYSIADFRSDVANYERN